MKLKMKVVQAMDPWNVIWVCVAGHGWVNGKTVLPGDLIIIPRCDVMLATTNAN